jgi:hypothetical protein
MTWKDKTVIRILLIVAKMVSPTWSKEIDSLSAHISCSPIEPKEAALNA